MLKAYLIISFIYAALKTVGTDEQTLQGTIGFFLSRFLGSFYYIIKDIVLMFIPKTEPKGRR